MQKNYLIGNNIKKVTLYIPSMSGGGAERVMLALANGLAEKDIQVDLLLNRVDGPYLKDASKKVNIVNLNTSRVISSIVPLSKYLRREKPDAILSAMNYVNIITVIAQIVSVASKNQKAFMADLKCVYRAATLNAAETALDDLEAKWATSTPWSSSPGAASGRRCRLTSNTLITLHGHLHDQRR